MNYKSKKDKTKVTFKEAESDIEALIATVSDEEKSVDTNSSGKEKTFKSNSAFKRAMTQMNIKTGQKVVVAYDDGSRYTVYKSV